jgi:hypothetical protein
MTIALAIGAAVLMLIAGLWYALGASDTAPNYSGGQALPVGTHGRLTAPGLGSTSDIIIVGTDPKTGKPLAQLAGEIDAQNEANKALARKLIEDMSSGSSGALLNWRHRSRAYGIVRYDVGRLATIGEAADAKTASIPGFSLPMGQVYVAIEFTKPYSFFTYDRNKYLILISGTIDTSLTPVVIAPSICVFDKKKDTYLASFNWAKEIGYKAQGLGRSAIRAALKVDPCYKEFMTVAGMPNGAGRKGYAGGFIDISKKDHGSNYEWNTVGYCDEALANTVVKLRSLTLEAFT